MGTFKFIGICVNQSTLSLYITCFESSVKILELHFLFPRTLDLTTEVQIIDFGQ